MFDHLNSFYASLSFGFNTHVYPSVLRVDLYSTWSSNNRMNIWKIWVWFFHLFSIKDKSVIVQLMHLKSYCLNHKNFHWFFDTYKLNLWFLINVRDLSVGVIRSPNLRWSFGFKVAGVRCSELKHWY